MAVLHLALLPVPLKVERATKPDQYSGPVNADTLQDIFWFTFALLHHTALDGIPIDFANRKIQRCFPILSAWVADYMETLRLHGSKSNACPTCELPAGKLGTDMKNYRASDYAKIPTIWMRKAVLRLEVICYTAQVLGPWYPFVPKVFLWTLPDHPPDVHTPHMLHTVYQELFIIWCTGSKPCSKKMTNYKLLRMFERHSRRTLGIWYP